MFVRKDGFDIARFEDIPWTHRVRFDGMKSRARIYTDGLDYGLRMTLVDFPVGSTEPRHVHPGTHATAVLKNRALVDGLTLKPLDVILGPGNEPHGPLEYPDGCNLISCFQGSNDHSEVKQLSSEKNYRLVLADAIAWRRGAIDGIEEKTLIDRGAGSLLMQVWRCAPGAIIGAGARDTLRALLVVDGAMEAADGELGRWDMLRMPPAGQHGSARFPRGATLLVVTMR
jgi:quercetin dioxygenase-like cupin family protein